MYVKRAGVGSSSVRLAPLFRCASSLLLLSLSVLLLFACSFWLFVCIEYRCDDQAFPVSFFFSVDGWLVGVWCGVCGVYEVGCWSAWENEVRCWCSFFLWFSFTSAASSPSSFLFVFFFCAVLFLYGFVGCLIFSGYSHVCTTTTALKRLPRFSWSYFFSQNKIDDYGLASARIHIPVF